MEILLMLSSVATHPTTNWGQNHPEVESEIYATKILLWETNTGITKNVLNATLNGFVPIVKGKKEDLRNPERKDYCGVIEMVTFIVSGYLTWH